MLATAGGSVVPVYMDVRQADQLIQQMETDYDVIASHFSSTRHEGWPEFGSLRALITAEDAEMLDIGCGNGRLIASLPPVRYTGLDLSEQLLQIARQKFPDYKFIHGSMLKLPFADASFDIVACVAALQHIPSVRYRQQALREMARGLKPGGHLFMLNWNLNDQPKYQTHRASQTEGYDEGDYLIPWKTDQGEVKAKRYYHGFGITEIAELAEGAELKVMKNEVGPENRNIVTIAKK